MLKNFADNLTSDSAHRKTVARDFLFIFGFQKSNRGVRLAMRALVVDDYEPWLRFTCSKLQEQDDMQVIGRVSDGIDAVRRAEELKPDLILLDIGLPSLNGIEVARRIRDVSFRSQVLFVSENRCPAIVEEALSTGAVGYVVKSDAGNELLSALESVLEGKRFVSSSVHDFTNAASE